MSQRIHKVGWFYLLILFLPMLACNSLPDLQVTSVANAKLRQGLEAIPLAAPMDEASLPKMNGNPKELSAAESEQVRLMMQHAWRAIFLPLQPYAGAATWRKQSMIDPASGDVGVIYYRAIAFDKLSAEATYADTSYRCVQDGEKSFFTKASLQGAWVSSLREMRNDPIGGGTHHLITDCNEAFLGLLTKTTDPFTVSHTTEPTTWYYPITDFSFDASLERPITPNGKPTVGYRMVSNSFRIEIWMNAETRQPLSLAYSDGAYVIYWRFTELLDDLVIETPQVTR